MTKFYFFSGKKYIRVTREEQGPGTVDEGYPKHISTWGWGDFGAEGIDAALYSGNKCYFFAGKKYIRVTRGEADPGTVDEGYPKHISTWGWGDFGAEGIDAALYSGNKCYFFAGKKYIRVTRGAADPGTVDEGYPKHISRWGWGDFGAEGIDAALYSGSKCYFFAGKKYIRVTRGAADPGTVDEGYPKHISRWGWDNFGQDGIKAAFNGGVFVPAPTQQSTPDGKVPKFPIILKEEAARGEAKVQIDDDGVVTLYMKVDTPAASNTTKYAVTVLITGYKDDDIATVLASKIPAMTLTLGSNPVNDGTKDETRYLTILKQEDLMNIRHVRLFLKRDQTSDDLVTQFIETCSRAGDAWDASDSLYRKVKNSELGRAILLMIANA